MNDDTDDEIVDTEIRTPRVEPEPVDEGKDVVCADGRTIGMVTRVRGDTLYVDPDTSLSDRLERRLDWDGSRRTDLPLRAEFIERISGEVVLTIRRARGVDANRE